MSGGCGWIAYNPVLGRAGRCERQVTRYGLCAEHNARWEAEHTLTCQHCGTSQLLRKRPPCHQPWACSPECRRAVRAAAARSRRAAARQEPTSVPCAHCAQSFVPVRKDALFCSGACRVAAHRAKQRTA